MMDRTGIYALLTWAVVIGSACTSISPADTTPSTDVQVDVVAGQVVAEIDDAPSIVNSSATTTGLTLPDEPATEETEPPVEIVVETTTTTATTSVSPTTITTKEAWDHPTEWTVPQPVTPEPKKTLVIHGIGDVALDPVYIPTFPSEGYEYAWSGLDGIFLDDDLTVINMECSVSDLGRPAPKTFNFRCDTDALPSAKAAGIDVANLANNHSLDFGREAMLDSIRNLREAGIHPVGAGANYEEAYSPALLEIGGWKIAVLGFGGVLLTRSWLATEDRPGIASGDDKPDMVAAVERAEEMADLVIVTIHWGMEKDTQPRPGDIDLAEAMMEAGADIIFGHHQHRVGPLGRINGKPVAWGLGHIIWRRINPVSAQTTVAKVIVHPDGTMGACLMPAEIIRHGHPVFIGETPGECIPEYEPLPYTPENLPPMDHPVDLCSGTNPIGLVPGDSEATRIPGPNIQSVPECAQTEFA
ncbi:MAG: CapA family protein [bacterium]|nr:CapA family protein [bacterium]